MPERGIRRRPPASRRLGFRESLQAGLELKLRAHLDSGNDQIALLSPLGYLDATISYELTDSFELRLDALNITNENTYIYYEDPDQPSDNGLTRRDNSVFNGRTIAVGIRGQF